jgi:hypothetical protein
MACLFDRQLFAAVPPHDGQPVVRARLPYPQCHAPRSTDTPPPRGLHRRLHGSRLTLTLHRHPGTYPLLLFSAAVCLRKRSNARLTQDPERKDPHPVLPDRIRTGLTMSLATGMSCRAFIPKATLATISHIEVRQVFALDWRRVHCSHSELVASAETLAEVAPMTCIRLWFRLKLYPWLTWMSRCSAQTSIDMGDGFPSRILTLGLTFFMFPRDYRVPL